MLSLLFEARFAPPCALQGLGVPKDVSAQILKFLKAVLSSQFGPKINLNDNVTAGPLQVSLNFCCVVCRGK